MLLRKSYSPVVPIANTCSIGYPHDGRADNAAYRHDRRADNAAYRHDRRADSLSLYEPRCDKPGLRGFRPGLTQTDMYSHRYSLVSFFFMLSKCIYKRTI